MQTNNAYEFIEWYKLNLDIMVDLITLIEDVRYGANIELWKFKKRIGEKYFLQQKELLEYVLIKFGLLHEESDGYYYISKDATLIEQLCSNQIKTGLFLGYPQCCIEKFEEGCKLYISKHGPGPAVAFWQEAKPEIAEGSFNEILYYTLHTPCKTSCQPSIILAEKIKKALEVDQEASYYLKEFNKNSFYQFTLHY